ncbi:MAG: hypothetical protein DYH13_09745 [Alphaproteobacteria bacterium PRO2]|nr:hypothetical protein [Alphaproteobacteria bacterium PRO2]
MKEKGSVLFILLIAVVLFAALAYAVARMMQGGNPDIINVEQSRLAGNEILAYAQSMRQAAQTIKISNGCADMDISVENGAVAGYTHTSVATDNCKLFHSDGGGLVYQPPVAEWLDDSISPAPALRGQWYFPANTCVPETGSAGAGCESDSADNEAIIAVLPYIKKQLCIQINNLLGVTNPGGNPPVETGNGWTAGNTKYTGAQADAETLDQAGKMAGCFEGDAASNPGAGTYHFFKILIPR